MSKISRDRWTDVAKLFGRVPDREIAAILGCSRATVARRRVREGIQHEKIVPPVELFDALGKDYDARLARKYGLDATYVSRLRRARGIDVYRPPHGTYSRYASGCRCEACREANRDRLARYRATGTSRRVGAGSEGGDDWMWTDDL